MAFESYTQLRQAEDVQDVIYNVSPVDNPVAAMSRTLRATGKLHEWTEDRLNAAAANRLVEGADAGTDDSSAVAELNNHCQIMGKVARISGTLEEVDKYGRDSEMAYQLELRYGELANDEELAIIGAPGNVRQTGAVGDGTTARQLECFQSQIAGGPNAASNVVASAAADIAALEAELLAAHQGAYDLGGNPNYLIVTPTVARYVAAFASATGRERDFGEGTAIVNVIDLYKSPYGSLDVGGVGNDEHIMAGIDFQYSATPVLRATRDYPLARSGDADNRQILRESTYALLNRDSGFMIDSIAPTL
jgi:hypothetical protein